jgi:hypothetical protein
VQFLLELVNAISAHFLALFLKTKYFPCSSMPVTSVVGTLDILFRLLQNDLLQRPGIEPGPPAWQASILPLNQRCWHMDSRQFVRICNPNSLMTLRRGGQKVVRSR